MSKASEWLVLSCIRLIQFKFKSTVLKRSSLSHSPGYGTEPSLDRGAGAVAKRRGHWVGEAESEGDE